MRCIDKACAWCRSTRGEIAHRSVSPIRYWWTRRDQMRSLERKGRTRRHTRAFEVPSSHITSSIAAICEWSMNSFSSPTPCSRLARRASSGSPAFCRGRAPSPPRARRPARRRCNIPRDGPSPRGHVERGGKRAHHVCAVIVEAEIAILAGRIAPGDREHGEAGVCQCVYQRVLGLRSRM